MKDSRRGRKEKSRVSDSYRVEEPSESLASNESSEPSESADVARIESSINIELLTDIPDSITSATITAGEMGNPHKRRANNGRKAESGIEANMSSGFVNDAVCATRIAYTRKQAKASA
jgi:hypothetical protein